MKETDILDDPEFNEDTVKELSNGKEEEDEVHE
jgi:hypothetical protein